MKKFKRITLIVILLLTVCVGVVAAYGPDCPFCNRIDREKIRCPFCGGYEVEHEHVCSEHPQCISAVCASCGYGWEEGYDPCGNR